MGYKLIILLGLLVGVLYSIHILVQDYQTLTAPKILRFLFKRDTVSQNYSSPSVRWKKILLYDRVQCARFLYCELGARSPDEEIPRGFMLMLSLEPRNEDRKSLQAFKSAYEIGRRTQEKICKREYPMCPFSSSVLLDLIKYMLIHQCT